MRQGFRVIDADTHVNPSFDVLLRYADQELRDRLDDLKPYMQTVKARQGQGDAEGLQAAVRCGHLHDGGGAGLRELAAQGSPVSYTHLTLPTTERV